jgi:N-methylhydantoinase A
VPTVSAPRASESLPAAEPRGDHVLLGVDVGGTFTDAALVSGSTLFTAKVPTTPADQAEGVMGAIELVLERAGAGPGRVSRFAHGMTVGTNALLEERGARTALLATEGFTDVIEIGRQARPELYRLCQAPPSPLVPPELRFGVRERMGARGVVSPLDERALDAVLDELAEAELEAVAICLLHSYADPDHERRVAAAVAERLPEAHVSASHEVLQVFREYERTSTTVIDAYLSPLLRGYLERLAGRAQRAGLPEPEIMQSSGGLLPALGSSGPEGEGGGAARHAAWTVLSGPAAGAVGASFVGNRSGSRDVVSLDMGGTSCDVCVIDEGRVRQTAGRTIGGRPLQLPTVDVHTVGAGGGSIGWADAGGALRVGPHSAGADPGPACYGRGGREPTVTDANLVLGYLDADSSLAGGLALDADAAEGALRRLGQSLDLGAEEAAEGVVRVADREMVGALRVVTVERGVDPRRYTLVAFGGAGPMHAARLADELEIERVLCPQAAGVLSALGLVTSDRRRDFVRSVLLSGTEVTGDAVDAAVSALAARALAEMPDARIEVSCDVRYKGQSFELTVPADERPDEVELRARFEQAHEDRYGYSDPEADLELVNVRVAAVLESATPELEQGTTEQATAAQSSRHARFSGEQLETAVLRGALRPGDGLEGPAVLELPETTVLVPPGWAAEVLTDGTLALARGLSPRYHQASG